MNPDASLIRVSSRSLYGPLGVGELLGRQLAAAGDSVAALPRNPSGKILKREREERFGGSRGD